MVPAAPLLSGGVVMYGFLRGLLPTLQQARRECRTWVYVDRGYFRATRGDDRSGYFRITRNDWQHDGAGQWPADRWRALAIPLAAWRRGRHVLVCPPSDVFAKAVGGFPAAAWLADTLAQLKAATDRPIRVRGKDANAPLAQDLKDCHALVTFMSNTAVDALVAGVPVFCTGKSAASLLGKSNLAEIEDPLYSTERERWAASLACNQYTLAEFASGAANHLLEP